MTKSKQAREVTQKVGWMLIGTSVLTAMLGVACIIRPQDGFESGFLERFLRDPLSVFTVFGLVDWPIGFGVLLLWSGVTGVWFLRQSHKLSGRHEAESG